MPDVRKARVKKEDINYGFDSIFPEKLRKLLDDKKATQDDLAEYAGVSRQSVAQWKDGKTKPDIHYLKRIAEFFDVSADWLIGLAKDPTTDVDLKAISEYTGLDSAAVASLKLFPKYIPIINELLRNIIAEKSVLFNIDMYFKFSKKDFKTDIDDEVYDVYDEAHLIRVANALRKMKDALPMCKALILKRLDCDNCKFYKTRERITEEWRKTGHGHPQTLS